MKLAGLLLIVLCGALTGMTTASALTRRHTTTQTLISALTAASDRLRYLSPSMQSLLRLLAAQYPALPFLADCRDRLTAGEAFPEAWRQSLLLLPDGRARDILTPLGEELGSTDLESQRSALGYAAGRLGELAEQEREYNRTHTRLYRSLGVLGGIALAILLI